MALIEHILGTYVCVYLDYKVDTTTWTQNKLSDTVSLMFSAFQLNASIKNIMCKDVEIHWDGVDLQNWLN